MRTGAAPLNEAVYKNQLGLIELLLANGAQITMKDRAGFSPLANAIQRGQSGAVKMLADHAGNSGAIRSQLLEEAVNKGYPGMINLLIERGADLNAALPSGPSPVDLAARKGRPEIVELLVTQGAKVNVRDPLGASPLHSAAMFGNAAVVRVLLDRGANIDEQESATGATPLLWAVSAGRVDTVRLLLEKGADPNICTKQGISPRKAAAENELIVGMIAAKRGRQDCGQP